MFDGAMIESAHVGTVGTLDNANCDDVSWRQAHSALQQISRQRAVLDVEEARWLVIAKRTGAHIELGFATFLEYAERTLGYRRRVAFERLRVAEKLEDLPETRELLAAGAISYSAVREVTRVAERDTERAWLDAIEGKTIREIEDLVAGAAPGDHPDDPRDPDLEPRRWSAELDADVYAAVLEARRVIEEEHGGTLDDNAFVAALCERALRTAAPTPTKPPYQIALTICERCERATQDAGGRIVDVAPTVVERAHCDAEHLGHVDTAAEPTTSAIPAPVRRLVLRRDHHRCQAPGCRGSKWLEVHHIIPRHAGGTHDPANLITLCGAHHRAHHEGRLAITGTAPDGLRFERRDGSLYGDDFFAQAKSALRNLGWKPSIADAAVERVRAHVSTGDPLEAVIAAALRECPFEPQ